MNRTLALHICLPLAVMAAGCSSLPDDHLPGRVDRLSAQQAARLPPPEPTLALADIEAMQKGGAAPDAIVARIRERGTTFRLATADVLRLSRGGVPDSVIDFMLNAERSAAQENCAGELARRDRELQLRLQQHDQDWMLRCNAMYPPFYSPFFPHRRYWW